MKATIVCMFAMVLIGSAMCSSRHRRQAPPGMGPPKGIATPPKSIKGPADIKDLMMGDVKNQAAMGVPIDPDNIDAIQGGGADLGKTGLGIANPSAEKVAGLQTPPADIVGDAAAPPA